MDIIKLLYKMILNSWIKVKIKKKSKNKFYYIKNLFKKCLVIHKNNYKAVKIKFIIYYKKYKVIKKNILFNVKLL
jgi:hypothetical protein